MSHFGPSVVVIDVLLGSRPFILGIRRSDPVEHSGDPGNMRGNEWISGIAEWG
jgi:hypothetical protein